MRGDRPELEKNNQSDAAATTRANIYYALAHAFDRPDNWPEDFEDLLKKSLAEVDAARPGLVTQVLEGARDKRALSITHAKLFLGPFDIQVAPWASSYLDPEQRLMGPYSRFAAEAYAEAGLAPGDGPADAPDHVTHELEFMYFLAFQEAVSDDEVWRERQTSFWRGHLGHWLPRFASAVEDTASDSMFFAALAGLLQIFCEREVRCLGRVEALSQSLS